MRRSSFVVPALRYGYPPWVFAVLLAAVVCWLLFIYVQEPIPSNLTYVIIATTFFGPLAFGWRPFLAASVVILVAVAIAMAQVNLEGAVDWGIGILAALVVSGVLLSMRLRLLRELADSERRNALLSTSDALTGLLNRRGLRGAAARPSGRMPARRGEPIRVCFLDVRGLKRANDEHGHDFGDLVITDVADAITGDGSCRGPRGPMGRRRVRHRRGRLGFLRGLPSESGSTSHFVSRMAGPEGGLER